MFSGGLRMEGTAENISNLEDETIEIPNVTTERKKGGGGGDSGLWNCNKAALEGVAQEGRAGKVLREIMAETPQI